MKTVVVDGGTVVDEPSFHKAFAEVFGFPRFYGNNLDAWIDCMSYLDDPGAGRSTVHVATGQVLTISVNNADRFKAQCPELWASFLECAAFVNWRRVNQGEPPILAVSANA